MEIKGFKFSVSIIIFGFLGGVTLSLLELMNMMSRKEAVDLFFLGGAIIAGVFGIIGAVLTKAVDPQHAFTGGIAAPQLISGLAKAGTAGLQAVSLLLAPFVASPVYAGPKDSVEFVVMVEGHQDTKLVTKDTTIILSDMNSFKLKRGDSIMVVGQGFEKHVVVTDTLGKKIMMKITLSYIETRRGNLLRGFMARQDKAMQENIDVNIEMKSYK